MFWWGCHFFDRSCGLTLIVDGMHLKHRFSLIGRVHAQLDYLGTIGINNWTGKGINRFQGSL